jgi:SAM-dependent methyltransferase
MRRARRDRADLVGHLAGEGIELGALNLPLDLSTNPRVTRIRYLDRHRKDEMLLLFPELRAVQDTIVDPDILCDLIHGFAPIADGSQDFVIACHLIEHMPDPIHFINACWRVLREGGTLFLAAPHRQFGPDHPRPTTTLAHVIDDHRRAERTIEDHHLEEYLRLSENLKVPEQPEQRRAFLDYYRDRSIHVHVWDAAAFAELLAYCSRTSAPFALLDAAGPGSTDRREMVVVLRKVRSAPDLERRLNAALVR